MDEVSIQIRDFSKINNKSEKILVETNRNSELYVMIKCHYLKTFYERMVLFPPIAEVFSLQRQQ